ncbi:MAG: hypothetical protein IPL46_23660 [Saprospiraceae bacterium]|nr:hypothetical protein [Saprospiraceae bacterium]
MKCVGYKKVLGNRDLDGGTLFLYDPGALQVNGRAPESLRASGSQGCDPGADVDASVGYKKVLGNRDLNGGPLFLSDPGALQVNGRAPESLRALGSQLAILDTEVTFHPVL